MEGLNHVNVNLSSSALQRRAQWVEVYSTNSQARRYMQVRGQFDPPAAMFPAKRTPGKQRIGGCVGPKTRSGHFLFRKLSPRIEAYFLSN